MRGSGHSSLRKGRYSIPGCVYHVVTTTRERNHIFSELLLARAVARTLFESPNARILAYALMPDHLHYLLKLGDKSLAEEVKAFKAISARRVNQLRGESGSVWAKGFYDRALKQEEDLRQAARYVVANPLKAGLASSLAFYSHWDAVWMDEATTPERLLL